MLAGMDAWNQGTHGRSGLIDKVKAATLDEAAIETAALAFLREHVPAKASPMCGNSICQDRRFLARWMPALEDYFHYRNLDVSTLKELARRWKPELMKGVPKEGKHEALADVYESIAELKYYRENFIRSQVSPARFGTGEFLPRACARAVTPSPEAHEAGVDAAVVANLHRERAQRDGVGLLVRGIGDGAAPQHVVDRDQSACAQELEARLVVGVVAGLVGIDEREIEAAGTVLALELGERLLRRPQMELDAIGDARLGPVAARDRRPLVAHVAADETAAGRKSATRWIARCSPVNVPISMALRAPMRRTRNARNTPLIGADLHAAHRQLRGLLAQPLLERRLARHDRAEVVIDGLRQQRTVGHGRRTP